MLLLNCLFMTIRYLNVSVIYVKRIVLLEMSKLFLYRPFTVNVLPKSDAISKLSIFLL